QRLCALSEGWAGETLGRSNPVHENPGHRLGTADYERRVARACESLTPVLSRVAAGFARRLPPHVELGDLVGAGSLGLVAAVRQYVDKPAIELKRLVEQRVR